MKFLKKILFIFVLLGGLSVASMAQKNDDQKKPPPKNPPPVINPGKGNQNPPPKGGGDKPKKPSGAEAVLWRKDNGAESA
jgi:hypothetical protein